MDVIVREMTQAVRRLARRPGFTVAALATMALGIGATTAIFSVVETVLLRSMPYEDGGRLVSIGHVSDTDVLGMPDGGFLHYMDRSNTVESMGLWVESSAPVAGLGEPIELGQIIATHDLLPTLGVEPVMGRGFVPDDHAPGAQPVVLVSHGFWTRHMGADPDAVGKPMLEGSGQTVIGVLPEGFDFLRPEAVVVFGNRFGAPDVYYPLTEFDPATARFGNFIYHAIGRLSPGATVDEAQREFEALMLEATEAYPGGITVTALQEGRYRPRVEGMKAALVGDLAEVLWILLGSVVFVMLIALANVANLFLVRAESRTEEVAVRRALGASRWAVRLAFISESLLVAAGGGALGVALATVATSRLVRLVPGDVPRLDTLALNWTVLSFSLALSVSAGLVLGVIPMLRRETTDLRSGMHASVRSGTGRRRGRLRSLLVGSQVALALTLMVGSGLLFRSFQNLDRIDPGFDGSRTMTLRLPLSGSILTAAGFPSGPPADARRSAFMLAVTERLSDIPGVAGVGFSADLPLDGDEWHDDIAVEGAWPAADEPGLKVQRVFIGPGYLGAIGATMLAGREFDRTDFAEQPRVVVVNQSFAEQRWPGQDPVGRRLAQYHPTIDPETDIWYTVTGVVDDVREASLMTPPEPTVYLPAVFLPAGNFSMWISNMVAVVRTEGESRALLPRIREEILAFRPDVPINNIATLDEITEASFGEVRFTMLLIGIASMVSLLLGVVGVYGAVSYIVAQRTREFGLRIALGASRRTVARGIIRYGGMLGAAGVTMGLISAVIAARVMESLLFGVSARDPWVYFLVSVVLFAVVLVACVVPARRAAAVDPVLAMRE